MTQKIGITIAPSNTQESLILVKTECGEDSLKNKLIYFDVETKQKTKHRAIGFIHEVTTENSMASDIHMQTTAAGNENGEEILRGSDRRLINMKVVSVFSMDEKGNWGGQKPLPTSPTTGTPVYIAGNEEINTLFGHHSEGVISYMGHLRGADDIPAPLILPDFGGARGASSIGFVGKTGSGKTDFASKFIASMMKYPSHFPLVVDPQGQWGNENGFTLSPQKIAKAMGREVHNLRVAEHIQLPMNDENLINMLTQIDLWAKLGRMAKENRDLLSVEVAELISNLSYKRLNGCTTNEEFKEMLTEVLFHIANSASAISRIYASEEKQKSFRSSLYGLIDPGEGSILSYISANGKAIASDLRANNMPFAEENVRQEAIDRLNSEKAITKNPDHKANSIDDTYTPEWLVSNAEMESSEKRWNGILAKFVPLMNLFQTHNLSGESRIPLSGEYGFLEKVLKIRNPLSDPPAPYVILDMSPDTSSKAKADLLGGQDSQLNMRRLLDNDNIKANILMMIFSSLKEASEEAFANGGGNLNTQIIFDEAWRYAPDKSDNEVIMELAKMLEGFALDTRKFGIGWTYILQSPTDLRHGIWKQLKFVFAGYGLVGADLNRMADLMDDSQNQLKTYKQFVSPDLTGEYPFMMVGSISPLITAQVPLFVNSYTSLEGYLHDNREWMNMNTKNAGKPAINAEMVRPGKQMKRASSHAEGYAIGKNGKREDFVSTFKPDEAPKRIAMKDPFADADAPPF